MSADILAAHSDKHSLPAGFLGENTRPSRRSPLLLLVEIPAFVFSVGMTQLLMVSLAINESQAPVTRWIAGAELAVAVIWTANVLATAAGLRRNPV